MPTPQLANQQTPVSIAPPPVPAVEEGVTAGVAPPSSSRGPKKGLFEWLSQQAAAAESQFDKTLMKVDNYFSESPLSSRGPNKTAVRSVSREQAQIVASQRATREVEDLITARSLVREELRDKEAKLAERQASMQALEKRLEAASEALEACESARLSETSTSAGNSSDANSSSHRQAFADNSETGDWKKQKMRQWDHRPLVPTSPAKLPDSTGWCGGCQLAPASRIEALETHRYPTAPASSCEPAKQMTGDLPSAAPRSIPSMPAVVSALER